MLSYLHRIVLWSLPQLDVRHQGIRWLQPRRTWLVNVELYPRVLLTSKSVSALLGLCRVQAILQSSSFYGPLVKSLHCWPQYPCFSLIRLAAFLLPANLDFTLLGTLNTVLHQDFEYSAPSAVRSLVFLPCGFSEWSFQVSWKEIRMNDKGSLGVT